VFSGWQTCVSYIKADIEENVPNGHSQQKNLHALEYAKQHGVMMT
jgi:hypothetical protein